MTTNEAKLDKNIVDIKVAENQVIKEVAKSLSGLRYGSVEITVHDGKVTQIESRKKIRFS